ncbi:MAG: hypothetical protein ACI9F9_002337, partial [Candidatus Paceibacteria bacterium]
SMEYNQVAQWVRPVVHWSFWLQWLTTGIDPLPFRLFNLLLHGANCVLVAWLAGVLIENRRAGMIAGTGFALLPIHPEAVTWIAGRSDLLSTLGVLWALLAWTRCCCEGGRWRHAVLAGAGLALAVLSKEMGVVTIALIFVLSLSFFRSSLRRQRAGLLLFVVLSALYLVLRVQLLGGIGGSHTDAGETLQTGLEPRHAMLFASKAIRFMISPVHEMFHTSTGAVLYKIALYSWIALTALALLSRERLRVLRLGLPLALMLVISLAPVANWAFINPDFRSTRYLYLPSVFTCIALGVLATRVGRSNTASRSRTQLPVLCLGVLAIWAVWSHQLVVVNRTWNTAGQQTRSLLETMPELRRRPKHIIAGLPRSVNGAFVYRNGYRQAVELFVGEGLTLHLLKPDEWEDMRQQVLAGELDRSPRHFLRWDEHLGWTEEPWVEPVVPEVTR